MTRAGAYDAEYEGPEGSLFVYGETPLASAKLNRWHANIDSGFWLLQQTARLLAAQDGSAFVLGDEGQEPLKVLAQASPDMTVRVSPGYLVGSNFIAGLSEAERLPSSGLFHAPTANPRIDAIGIAWNGDWVVAEGIEAAAPAAPTLPGGAVKLAEIRLRVGALSIQQADDGINAHIVDARPPRLVAAAHSHAEGAAVGGAEHPLTVFQPALEGMSVMNSSGIPEAIYNGSEDYWHPRLANTNAHVIFTAPWFGPGTRIRSVKMIVSYASSWEGFNFAVVRRSALSPQSQVSLLGFAATDYNDQTSEAVAGDFYSIERTLDFTIPEHGMLWVRARLKSYSQPQDCRLLGIEWTYEQRRY